MSYTYDMAGVRSSKTVNGTTYNYTTLSGLVVRQEWGNNSIDFIYDESNQPYLMRYKEADSNTYTTYYYVLNVQGDVVGLLNSSGTLVAQYEYDPWGKVLSVKDGNGVENTSDTFIGNINPLRYRGYYYDNETGFYYLQTRYYDPAICRFINADSFTTTDINGLLSSNMFAYCENNPIMGVDRNGEFLETVLDVISLGMSVAEVAACPADPWAWASLIGDVVDLIPCVTGVGEGVRAVKTARYAKKAVSEASDVAKTGSKLHRPYVRKATRAAVESKAKKSVKGQFLDANTLMPINGKYDLGHKPGYEYWRLRDAATSRGWSQKQFNDYLNNPKFYQIEDPFNNRSHIFELKRR